MVDLPHNCIIKLEKKKNLYQGNSHYGERLIEKTNQFNRLVVAIGKEAGKMREIGEKGKKQKQKQVYESNIRNKKENNYSCYIQETNILINNIMPIFLNLGEID